MRNGVLNKMSNNIVRIEVHKDLQEVLENLRATVANDMKCEYGISEITVPRTLSSQILAAKHKGMKSIDIRIRKTGLTSGVLELL